MNQTTFEISFFYVIAKIGSYLPREIFIKIIGRKFLFFVQKGKKKKLLSKNEETGLFTCLSEDAPNPNFLSRVSDVIIAPDKILLVWSNNQDDCWAIERNTNSRENFDSLKALFHD